MDDSKSKLEILKSISEIGPVPANIGLHNTIEDLISIRDVMASSSKTVEENMNKLMSKDFLGKFFVEAMTTMTENIIWYYAKEHSTCIVCKISIILGDKCRVSDCAHSFHVECGSRYMDRCKDPVSGTAKCPGCGIEITEKISFPTTSI